MKSFFLGRRSRGHHWAYSPSPLGASGSVSAQYGSSGGASAVGRTVFLAVRGPRLQRRRQTYVSLFSGHGSSGGGKHASLFSHGSSGGFFFFLARTARYSRPGQRPLQRRRQTYVAVLPRVQAVGRAAAASMGSLFSHGSAPAVARTVRCSRGHGSNGGSSHALAVQRPRLQSGLELRRLVRLLPRRPARPAGRTWARMSPPLCRRRPHARKHQPGRSGCPSQCGRAT